MDMDMKVCVYTCTCSTSLSAEPQIIQYISKKSVNGECGDVQSKCYFILRRTGMTFVWKT